MRVVYYTQPCFFDSDLPLVRELSRLVELHLVLELSPEAWSSGLFDVPPRSLPDGVVPAEPVLKDCFPHAVRTYWENAASFSLSVHNSRRSIHPTSWLVSHRTTQFVRSLKPDVLHLVGVSLRAAWALPELRQIPMVLSIHDPEPHAEEQDWRGNLARRLTFGRAARFILHNEALREPFCTHHRVSASRVDVTPLGILNIFREWITRHEPEDDHTVLFFGRLSRYKGLETLYQAAPLVTERVPGVCFVVAGRAVAGYIPPLAPVLSNGASVELHEGYVSNAQAACLFQRATVVVCPYIDATQSGVVLTAYAFGKPVIATQVGGLAEYVFDGVTGMLVPPGDPTVLADALSALLLSRDTRDRFKSCINQLEEGAFSWRTIAEQTIASYYTALRR